MKWFRKNRHLAPGVKLEGKNLDIRPIGRELTGIEKRVWSLWEMIEHRFSLLHALLRLLEQEIDALKQRANKTVSSQEKLRLKHSLVEDLHSELAAMFFAEVPANKDTFSPPALLWHFNALLSKLDDGSPLKSVELKADLEAIQRDITLRLMDCKFVFIPSPNDKYFEQQHLFGLPVHVKFEEAREEIKDAGNAFAAGLYTACVFHSVRVLEHALRAVATAMNVTITDKRQPIPLPYGDWTKVLDQIGNKIDAARLLANNAEKEEIIKRFSEASDRLTWAKDQWRNDICHTRTRFTFNEAQGILERVQGLMEFLGNTLEKQW